MSAFGGKADIGFCANDPIARVVSYGFVSVNARRRAGRRQERTPRYAPRADRSLLAASWGSLRTAPGAGRARRQDPGRTALSLRGAPGRTLAATQVGRIASSRPGTELRPQH